MQILPDHQQGILGAGALHQRRNQAFDGCIACAIQRGGREIVQYRMERFVLQPLLAGQMLYVAARASYVFRHDINQQRFTDARPAANPHAAWCLCPWQACPDPHQRIEFAHSSEHASHRPQIARRIEYVLLGAVAHFEMHGELRGDAITQRRRDQDFAGFGKVGQSHGVVAQRGHQLRRLGRLHRHDVRMHAQTHAYAFGNGRVPQFAS